MKYNNEEIRRRDRQLDEARARELLKEGEYGVMSMVDPQGEAYGLPISYAWDEAEHIYLHCAPVGRKLACIEAQPRVSFSVVGMTEVVPEHFTTKFESVVLQCAATTALDPKERMHALALLVAKYCPDHIELGAQYAEMSFKRTNIIRLDIDEWSGKAKYAMRKMPRLEAS